MKIQLAQRYTGSTALIISLLVMISGSALAHEPIFGIGPHTMFQGGVGIEAEFESHGGDRSLVFENIYGLTEDLSATFLFAADGGGVFRNPGLRIKHRIARKESLGVQDSLAYVLGAQYITGTQKLIPLVAFTAGQEALVFYYFGSVRYNTQIARADVVFGYRPSIPDYYGMDSVFIVEWSGQQTIGEPNNIQTFFAPGALISYRNWMLKLGWEVPFAGGPSRIVAALEVHM